MRGTVCAEVRAVLAMVVLACTTEPDQPVVPPAAPTPDVQVDVLSLERLQLDLGPRRAASFGRSRPLDGYAVQDVALDAAPGLRVGAAIYLPDEPSGAAVLMAHGHFDGGGKSAPEAQELSHRLARRGVTVLAVDNPGMEAWGGPGRALHGERGAVNRWWLAAAGSSAIALQLGALEAGLDVLDGLGSTEITATGASGGAVLSFWLAVLDDRVDRVVLAAVPDVPRRPDEGGCPCKVVPGLPGPDAGVLARLDVPSLWLSERRGSRPEGLPAQATWKHVPGPHSYTEAMQREALAFLELPATPWEPVPSLDLRGQGPGEQVAHVPLKELPFAPDALWAPAPTGGVTPELSCRGEGPTVVVAGDEPAPLIDAGFRACVLTVDTSGADAALARGEVFVDQVAGAVSAAVASSRAIAAWGRGAWAVPIAGSGVPHVLREPLASVDELGPETAWVQAPGLWWGVLPGLWSDALAVDPSPAVLIAALPE